MNSILERLERRFSSLNENECWMTGYALNHNGYASIDGGQRLHRLVWEAHNAEPVPEGMVVRHTCDNRACCNPFHLEIGTQKQNIQDMVERNRGRYRNHVPKPKPSKPPRELKINSDVISQVKALLAEGFTYRAISERMNIGIASVSRIKHAG